MNNFSVGDTVEVVCPNSYYSGWTGIITTVVNNTSCIVYHSDRKIQLYWNPIFLRLVEDFSLECVI